MSRLGTYIVVMYLTFGGYGFGYGGFPRLRASIEAPKWNHLPIPACVFPTRSLPRPPSQRRYSWRSRATEG